MSESVAKCVYEQLLYSDMLPIDLTGDWEKDKALLIQRYEQDESLFSGDDVDIPLDDFGWDD
jgi:hypothetical protein